MHAPPPRLSAAAAEELALELYGVAGRAYPLPGERDQNFRLEVVGAPTVLLKVSNPGEDPAVVAMQVRAMAHVAAADPELPISRVVPSRSGELVANPQGGGRLVRLHTFLPGHHLRPADLDPSGLFRLGATSARLGRALRGFFDPAADQQILWNPGRLEGVRSLLDWVSEPARGPVEAALGRSQPRLRDALRGLRSQVIHNDLSFSNLTFDSRGIIQGILDFGDLCHTALVSDLAVTCESILELPHGFDALATVAGGFLSVTELEEEELEILPDLLQARWATLIAVSSWRARAFPETAAYVGGWQQGPLRMLAQVEQIGEPRWRRLVVNAAHGAAAPALRGLPLGSTEELEAARQGLLGSALSPLSYRRPLHLVRGRGALLYDREGGEYLDAYNNVPVVGHGNREVAHAVGAQSSILNTNTRYLYRPVLELAERLRATLPQGLDTVMFVNSGSEANDLAWRLARAFTAADGAVVTRHAYHGMTAAVADFSPGEWHIAIAPPHVVMIDPPDGYRGPHRRDQPGWAQQYLAEVDAAVEELATRGRRPCALLVDPGFTSDGVHHPPPGYLSQLYSRWQRAGGLVIADEVQTGFGRLGTHLWGFARHGALPDIVTLGKPMGNGYPIGAVITRAEVVDALAAKTEWFSTFGGNPVACQAGLAVLNQVDEDGFRARVTENGERLGRALWALASGHEPVGDVRSLGLLAGVELVSEREQRHPDPGLAAEVVEEMRSLGVLAGRAGAGGNVIKIRPPLVVTADQVDRIAATLDRALTTAEERARGRARDL